MSSVQHILMVVASLILLLAVLALIARRRLQLRYALLWIILAVTLVVCAAFPVPMFVLSRFLGFETSSNFIFFVAVLFLLLNLLSLTVVVSRQAEAIKDCVQLIGILEHEIESAKTEAETNNE